MSRKQKQIKQFFRSASEMLGHERLYLWMLGASVLLWLAALALPIWRIVPLSADQPFLPLHYNVYFGVDRFGAWWEVFIIPLLGLLFLAVSMYMQTRFYRLEKMLARFFSISTTVLEAGLLTAMILIVLLNL